ncbi:MAG: phytase [Gammaproteobacteria bacterium RIFCSPHIGHO2_12_FULL_63_22]|nr:MAG: phytase [Gammaproteobacteria bacterium RIFCSPHIGHO2_12_FULL_63_22]
MRPRHSALVVSLIVVSACAPLTAVREPDEIAGAEPTLAGSGINHATVAEAFITARTPLDNIDSPASWTSPEGKVWLFATAKEGKGLVLYDGDTGATLRGVGTVGTGAGQFQRPNGVAVSGDLLFVVERDNRRVQVLSLPGLASLATFGERELQQPYGLWVRELAGGERDVLVTDAYMAGTDARGDSIVPPLARLDKRIHRYRVRTDGSAVVAELGGTHGDITEAGAIRIPESLWGDPAHDRLLVSEEDTVTGTAVREYSLSGEYRGRTIGLGQFKAQAEGIALWTCPDGSGYWLATDQFKDRSLFHVYDRQTLAPLGAFAGNTVANTDGVWLHQAATSRFPQGVFYAVHDDMAVAAFDWRDVASALSLRADCDG